MDLFEIIFAVIVALIWLLGGRAQQQRQKQQRRPPPMPQRVPGQVTPPPPRAEQEEARDRAIRQLEELLGVEIERREEPEPEVVPDSRNETLEEIYPEEAYSLETVEPDILHRPLPEEPRSLEEATIRRVPVPVPVPAPALPAPYARPYPAPYALPQPFPPPEGLQGRRRRFSTSSGTLRDVIVWREILGPPKGLE